MYSCSYFNKNNLECQSEVTVCITSEPDRNHIYCTYHYKKLIKEEDIKLEKFKEIFEKHNILDKYKDVINKYETDSYQDDIKIFEHILKLDAFAEMFEYIRDDIKTCFAKEKDFNKKQNYRNIIKDITEFIVLFYNKTNNKEYTNAILKTI